MSPHPLPDGRGACGAPPDPARHWTSRVADALAFVVRWLPAVALFSLAFALDGHLRWLGLLGVIPLLMQRAGCTACELKRRPGHPGDGGWPTFPGH